MLETSETDGVVTLTLTNPAKKNALTFDLLDRITEVATELAGRADVRAVILTGADGCFSSGMDFTEFMALANDMDTVRTELRTPARPDGWTRFQAPAMALAAISVPVIAATRGYCYGGAFQLALAADFRIAHPETKISIREGKWGMIPDMGITQFMGPLMRADIAKKLIMTAEVFDGHAALEYGLVTVLSEDPEAAAHALAQSFKETSPECIRAAKRLVNDGWDGGKDALSLEGHLQADLIGTPNQIEAVMAGMQKRTPKFT